MSDNSKIHWTEATWNCIRGCSRVSEGCRHCYAERMAARFSDEGYWGHGFAERTPAGPRWTGKVELVPSKLDQPIRWRKPRMIFVNSTSDLFHESLTNEEIAAVFGVMAACPQHTFQVLTKRAERMREWFEWASKPDLFAISNPGTRVLGYACARVQIPATNLYIRWPLPNVWLGVSAEDQAAADERIPHLLRTPAAVRFVSAEPLLGPINLREVLFGYPEQVGPDEWEQTHPRLDWVITGGESGPADKIRPADPDWFRAIRDDCDGAMVAYFHKQHGGSRMVDEAWGGRVLDGRTHDDMPARSGVIAHQEVA